MGYRIGSIDIHKKVLMVVVATVAAEVEDATGEAVQQGKYGDRPRVIAQHQRACRCRRNHRAGEGRGLWNQTVELIGGVEGKVENGHAESGDSLGERAMAPLPQWLCCASAPATCRPAAPRASIR